MTNTQKFDGNLSAIRRSCWFFIVVGVVEIFIFESILRSAELGTLTTLTLGIIPGSITIFSANRILEKNKERIGYFGSIWNMLKYNPIFFFMSFYILTDAMMQVPGNMSPAVNLYTWIFIVLLGIISFVLSIILTIRISKHNKILRKL